MLVAAVLFVAGLLLGWHFSVVTLVVSSASIFFVTSLLFAFTKGLGILQILVIFAYLLAHQAGYLVGAYLGYSYDTD